MSNDTKRIQAVCRKLQESGSFTTDFLALVSDVETTALQVQDGRTSKEAFSAILERLDAISGLKPEQEKQVGQLRTAVQLFLDRGRLDGTVAAGHQRQYHRFGNRG